MILFINRDFINRRSEKCTFQQIAKDTVKITINGSIPKKGYASINFIFPGHLTYILNTEDDICISKLTMTKKENSYVFTESKTKDRDNVCYALLRSGEDIKSSENVTDDIIFESIDSMYIKLFEWIKIKDHHLDGSEFLGNLYFTSIAPRSRHSIRLFLATELDQDTPYYSFTDHISVYKLFDYSDCNVKGKQTTRIITDRFSKGQYCSLSKQYDPDFLK